MSGTVVKLDQAQEAELTNEKCNWLCTNHMQCARKVEFERTYTLNGKTKVDHFCEYHAQLLLQQGEVTRES